MEENEPKQRRPRTSNPAFSTPDQPTPPAKPAKVPPAVTFRPPAEEKPSSGTGADAPPAKPSTQPRRPPAPSTPHPSAADPAGKAPPPSRSRAQAAAKPQPAKVEAAAKPQPAKVEAAADVPPPDESPRPPAQAQPKPPAPAKSTPAAKATTPAKRQPRKATPPTKSTPAAAAEPAKKAAPRATPAKAARPAKKAAATVRAAAAELAPAVVQPDPATIPDEPRAPGVPDETATSPTAEPSVTAPGQPEDAVPVGPTLPRAATALPDTRSGSRAEPWAALIADPGHSPELLAVAATQTIGPRAKEWAGRTRAAYPSATPDALARLAAQQFTRFGSVSSVFAAVAGSYAPLALLGAAAFTHAELALHIAAAYGLDPTDRERAADLLVLTRVHPLREDAEAALAAAATQQSYEHTGLTDATWRLGRMIAAQAGGWVAVRAVNHFFPGTSLLAATLTSRGAARAMAARATFFYRGQSQLSQSLGSSV
ncbi:hypothetical protein [Actinoplanes sp. NPDC049599]|uniref:hypothetical protein n=1 Tax=Actinoplanes sp. NPDC049599 TaxID=3363903 RepID=UPI003796DB9E